MRGAFREGSPPLAFLSPNRMVHLWRLYSGGSRPRHPTCGGTARGRGKTSPCCLLPHRLFLLGEVLLFALEGAGQSTCQSLQGRGLGERAGPADRGGLSGSFFSYTERYAGSWRGMSARLRCFANFFRTACEKKPSRVDVKTYFMTPGFLARAGRLFCLPKRENQQ